MIEYKAVSVLGPFLCLYFIKCTPLHTYEYILYILHTFLCILLPYVYFLPHVSFPFSHSFPFPFLLFPSLPLPTHSISPPLPTPSPQRTCPETSFITSLPLGVRRPTYLRDFILSLFSSSFTLRPFLFLSVAVTDVHIFLKPR